MNNEELKHYGVLGMKWGKRRAQRYEAQANRLTSKIDAKKSEGKKLTVRDGNMLMKAASLNSRAKDFRSDKTVTWRQSNKNASKARTEALREGKEYNKELRIKNKKDKLNAMIEDNDKRVGSHGKTKVKVANTVAILATINGMSLANKLISRAGGKAIRSMRSNSKYSDAQLKAVAGASLAAMAGVTIKSLKNINTFSNDIKLTNQYDNRQQNKKIEEMRKRISNLENK